jgi:hypothetical protein
MNILTKGFFCCKGLESLASVHIKYVEYVDCVQQYFSAGKEQRAYWSTCAVIYAYIQARTLYKQEIRFSQLVEKRKADFDIEVK